MSIGAFVRLFSLLIMFPLTMLVFMDLEFSRLVQRIIN